ncbi:MAG: aminotransferase class I/II-fold pyridoxal phosphate-dependent enzyme [Bacteroidota bacterium]
MGTSTADQRLSQIQTIVDKAKNAQVAHLYSEDESFNGRHITLNGQRMVNFASCNYLGLALDRRVIQGAKEGVDRYGTSFPTSRSFVSMGYLSELEDELEKLFGYPCLVTSTTSLGHIAWLPLLVNSNDAVILDHQVHNSVETATQLLIAKGAHIEVVRHNNMEKLENRIITLSEQYDHIWYMADGVYSMYGDKAPIKKIVNLLNKYPQLYAYIDDAHGMSWTGERGVGHVLKETQLHERMALITSLGKSFGSLGGAMVFPSQAKKDHVKECGGPLIFSSPLPASVIGASIASAQIHMSDELLQLQNNLLKRMACFKEHAHRLGLPIVGEADTPIFFIPVGNPDSAFAIGQKMMGHGFYQSLSVFPSVPMNNSGLRYTMTNWIEEEDIVRMLTLLAEERTKNLEQQGLCQDKVLASFKGVSFAV